MGMTSAYAFVMQTSGQGGAVNMGGANAVTSFTNSAFTGNKAVSYLLSTSFYITWRPCKYTKPATVVGVPLPCISLKEASFCWLKKPS